MKDTYNVKEDSGIVNVCLELVDGTIEGVIIGLLVNTSLSKLYHDLSQLFSQILCNDYLLIILFLGNITNEDLVICDNQTMQRQQICFDIAVIDDHVVESAETAVICGCSPYDVTFNGCITLTIEDNEGENNLNQML